MENIDQKHVEEYIHALLIELKCLYAIVSCRGDSTIYAGIHTNSHAVNTRFERVRRQCDEDDYQNVDDEIDRQFTINPKPSTAVYDVIQDIVSHNEPIRIVLDLRQPRSPITPFTVKIQRNQPLPLLGLSSRTGSSEQLGDTWQWNVHQYTGFDYPNRSLISEWKYIKLFIGIPINYLTEFR
jgi:hypothetical protein